MRGKRDFNIRRGKLMLELPYKGRKKYDYGRVCFTQTEQAAVLRQT